MTDKIKSINIINHSIHIPKIKGHMKIELTGSREKEVVEHDNHMTNIIEHLLDAHGTWLNPGKVLDLLTPATEKLYGGLLLTDKEIDDNALVLPAGTEVTACGSYKMTNNTSAVTLGNYNLEESVYDIDAAKMTYVYDWGTSKGNGTIAAAALTHVNGGMCSYGDAGISSNTTNTETITFYNTEISAYKKQPDNMTALMVTDDYLLCGTYASSTLTLYRISSDIKRIDALPFAQPSGIKYTNSIQTVFANVPNIDTSMPRYADGQDLYIAAGASCSAGGTLTLYKINDAMSDSPILETLQIRNNTGKEIWQYSGIVIHDDYLYVRARSESKLGEINILNPVDANVYNIGMQSSAVVNSALGADSGKIYIMSPNNYVAAVFDTVTKSAKSTMLRGYTGVSVVNNSLLPVGYSRDSKYAVMSIPYNFLSTINNLDAPLEKTADKTMKVTYTIQAV